MLTPARLREYTGESGALDLLRDLGYPVAAVDVDPEEWRRGGVSIPWNGEARLRLASRLRQFDLFLLTGSVAQEAISEFMRSYAAYNLQTKSAIIYIDYEKALISVFDLAGDRSLRRLDVDLLHPTTQSIDRLNLLAHGEEAALPRVFDRALDRENITREFFLRFRGAVGEVAKALAAACPGEERQSVDAQALLILSRLLFLSFVQEKGWLNGERRFLVDRLDHEIQRDRHFFSGVLMPLFFGALNTPLHERTLAARKLGDIPYLNGGLFDPSPFERRHPDMHLPNGLMRSILEEVFERFDFRIEEGDSAGVHVDPEMLGKVFESLMAADERAASGSFYTPKEIVDVLTEQAITEWLGDRGVDELERITILDPACGSGAFLLSALGVIERLWEQRTGSVPKDLRRRIIARSLYGIDLKPEAVRLCELRLWLAIVSGTDATSRTVEPLPNLDRNILQGNSLFSPTDFLGDERGDLYRDWLLALRAQSDLLERYRSAPHGQRPALCRIIRGNDQRLAVGLLSRSIERSERELQLASAPRRDLFGRAVPLDTEHCRELQQRLIDQRERLELAEEGSLDFFSFDVHFAHVMARGGFDVVLGNPPWVRNSRIDGRAKRMLADRYALFRRRGGGSAFHQPDLSLAFFERALSLAAPSGVVSLLMPSKIVNSSYAEPLRRAAGNRVVALQDWSDDARRRRWFKADTFPLGITLRGAPAAAREITVTACGESFRVSREQLRVSSTSSEWSLVPSAVARILGRLRTAHPPLEKSLRRKPFMGVKTGDNRNFFLDDAEPRARHLVTKDGIRIPFSAVCRCVRGRDLRRWTTLASHWMLWPPVGGWPNAPAWLERLAAARGIAAADLRLSFVRAEHVGIKVAWKDLSRGLAAAVLPDVAHVNGIAFPLVPNQTLYAIDAVSLDEAYVIAAMLNSTIAGAILAAIAERAKDSHYRYFGRTIAAMPWPDVSQEWDLLLRLSRRAHRGSDVMAELDRAVGRLYGVDSSELAILSAFLSRRLGIGE